MSLYLDASFIVPLFVSEAVSPFVQDVLLSNDRLTVSDFAAAEVASTVSRLVRMGQMAWPQAISAVSDLDAWRAAAARNIEMTSADMRLADALVRRFDLKLRTPDALHVAMAKRLGETLATVDKRLAAVARLLDMQVVAPSW